MPPPPSALENKLASSLASRDERLIRRKLPDPNASITSSAATSTTTTSSSSADAKLKQTSNERLIDFTSNDYLSLSTSPHLRNLFLQKLSDAPDILGSGGSRLLVNGRAHSAFEARLKEFFCGPTPPTSYSSGSGFDRGMSGVLGGRTVIATPNINNKTTTTTTTPAALLFNSGFDANVGFFSCIPQSGDAIVYDEYIHASVHDGIRGSRVERGLRRGFRHNDVGDLRRVLGELKGYEGPFASGTSSIFVSVESLYSMDGTFSPLTSISDILDEMFPYGNAYLIVDEAHATGIYGPQGRGRVAELGLEGKVLARLHTFGKALAATGAVIITTELIRDYLLNYARSLIYTTSLSYANIIAADASFDLLMDGTTDSLSNHLLNLSNYLTSTLLPHLQSKKIPPRILSLPEHLLPLTSPSTQMPVHPADAPPPSPIIPLLTSLPRPLSAYLLSKGMNARPITWPTVPKGKDRVRVCLHAGNTLEDVDALVAGCVEWAVAVLRKEEEEVRGKAKNVDTDSEEGSVQGTSVSVEVNEVDLKMDLKKRRRSGRNLGERSYVTLLLERDVEASIIRIAQKVKAVAFSKLRGIRVMVLGIRQIVRSERPRLRRPLCSLDSVLPTVDPAAAAIMVGQNILDALPLDILELVIREIKTSHDKKSFSSLRLVCKALNELVEPQAFSSVVIEFRNDENWRTMPEFLSSLASGTNPFGRWAKELVLYRLVPVGLSSDGWSGYDLPWRSDPKGHETMLACQKEWLIPAIESLVQVERVLFAPDTMEPYDDVLCALARSPRLQHLRVIFPAFSTFTFDHAPLERFSRLRSIELDNMVLVSHTIEGVKRILARSPSVTELCLNTHVTPGPTEVDGVDLSTLVEGVMQLPVKAIDVHTKKPTFSPSLKKLSISPARIRLSPSCVPFLGSLTSLDIRDDSTHVQPSFWKTFLNSRIRLQELSVSPLLSPIVDYLLSYSGLRSIELGGAKDSEGQTELEHEFFHSVLPMHRDSLQSISFRRAKLGTWAVNQSHLDEGVYRCKNLRYLHLIYYFPSRNEGGSVSTITLANLFGGISDNLPQLQVLRLNYTRKFQGQFPSYAFGYGAHFESAGRAFARQITSRETQFFARQQPQFLLELTLRTFISSPVGSVSSSGSGQCYQFQPLEVEDLESDEDVQSDPDADSDSDGSIGSGYS